MWYCWRSTTHTSHVQNIILSISQDKKSKESKNYLEDAVSGDKEDDFGSDADNNEPTEHVDDANAMGEY